MQTIQVDYKKETLEIKDQNKKLIWFLRLMLGLNILNAIIFYLVFNYQEDALKWIWLVFALFNVLAMYVLFAKVSLQNHFKFNEIKSVKKISFLGLFLELKDGKYRKIFIPSESSDGIKLKERLNH